MLQRQTSDFTTQLTLSFILLAISALMLASGLNFGVKPSLYISGITSFLLLAQLLLSSPKKALILLAPIAFITFVLVSPGTFFVDARIAGRLACALFAGIGLQLFLKKYSTNILFFLNISFSAAVLIGSFYGLLNKPEIFDSRLSLQFSNPQYFAFTAAITIFISIIYTQELPKKLKRVSYFSAWLAAFAIILSVSRSTYVGLLFSCGTYALIFHSKKIWKYVLVIALLLAISFPLLPQHQQQRLTNTISAPLHDNTVRLRLGIWYTALQGITHAPIMGNGLRTYTDFDMEYKASHLHDIEKIKYTKFVEKQRWANPHNLYLASLFGWGIIGTLLLIVAFIPALLLSKGRTRHFFILVTLFNLGYGLTDVYLKKDEGALFLFFPLGMAYGSILFERYSDTLKNFLPNASSPQTFMTKLTHDH
ncbi:MAG: O-antigen ligase family protein [Halodesulfovibrio sp.]|uniref:O-antigen ligase family protein n=1 Tax=Halodesulfovibrio sp. TaxID=1912772 RepID=UPI00359CBB12